MDTYIRINYTISNIILHWSYFLTILYSINS